MKRGRIIFWMVLAVLALVGVRILLDARGGGRSVLFVKQGVLASRADRATEFVVSHSNEPSVVVQQGAGVWRICAPFRGAADSQVVRRMGDALAFRHVEDVLSDAELLKLGRTRDDFGLAQPHMTVSVCVAGATNKVYLGETTPAGDGMYAAIEGTDLVYVVPTNIVSMIDLATTDFRSRQIFLDEEFPDLSAVNALDLRRGAGAFIRLSREGDKWVMKEPRAVVASASRIRAFLAKLFAAQACDFIWPIGSSNETAHATVALLAGYGLDSESAVTVTLRSMDGRDSSVSFGKEAGAGLVYALIQNGEALVTLDSTLKDLTLATSEAFLDSRIFPYDVREIAALSLADGDVNYLLSRSSEGQWRLEAPVVANADQTVVKSLIAKLLTLDTTDLEVGGIRVCMTTNAESVEVSREAVLANHRLADLRAKEICRIDEKDVTRIVVTQEGEKATSLVWDGERRVWNVESSQIAGLANEKAIAALFDVLNPLRAAKIVTIKVSATTLGTYGLASPRVTLALDFAAKDAVRRNVLIGNPAEDGYYATIGSSDAIFILPKETVECMIAPLVDANVILPEK